MQEDRETRKKKKEKKKQTPVLMDRESSFETHNQTEREI